MADASISRRPAAHEDVGDVDEFEAGVNDESTQTFRESKYDGGDDGVDDDTINPSSTQVKPVAPLNRRKPIPWVDDPSQYNVCEPEYTGMYPTVDEAATLGDFRELLQVEDAKWVGNTTHPVKKSARKAEATLIAICPDDGVSKTAIIPLSDVSLVFTVAKRDSINAQIHYYSTDNSLPNLKLDMQEDYSELDPSFDCHQLINMFLSTLCYCDHWLATTCGDIKKVVDEKSGRMSFRLGSSQDVSSIQDVFRQLSSAFCLICIDKLGKSTSHYKEIRKRDKQHVRHLYMNDRMSNLHKSALTWSPRTMSDLRCDNVGELNSVSVQTQTFVCFAKQNTPYIQACKACFLKQKFRGDFTVQAPPSMIGWLDMERLQCLLSAQSEITCFLPKPDVVVALYGKDESLAVGKRYKHRIYRRVMHNASKELHLDYGKSIGNAHVAGMEDEFGPSECIRVTNSSLGGGTFRAEMVPVVGDLEDERLPNHIFQELLEDTVALVSFEANNSKIDIKYFDYTKVPAKVKARLVPFVSINDSVTSFVVDNAAYPITPPHTTDTLPDTWTCHVWNHLRASKMVEPLVDTPFLSVGFGYAKSKADVNAPAIDIPYVFLFDKTLRYIEARCQLKEGLLLSFEIYKRVETFQSSMHLMFYDTEHSWKGLREKQADELYGYLQRPSEAPYASTDLRHTSTLSYFSMSGLYAKSLQTSGSAMLKLVQRINLLFHVETSALFDAAKTSEGWELSRLLMLRGGLPFYARAGFFPTIHTSGDVAHVPFLMATHQVQQVQQFASELSIEMTNVFATRQYNTERQRRLVRQPLIKSLNKDFGMGAKSISAFVVAAYKPSSQVTAEDPSDPNTRQTLLLLDRTLQKINLYTCVTHYVPYSPLLENDRLV